MIDEINLVEQDEPSVVPSGQEPPAGSGALGTNVELDED